MSQHDRNGFSTAAIHGTAHAPTESGALNPPLYLSSTFTFDSMAQGAARFAGTEAGHIYTRISNPTLCALEERFAALEGADAAVSFASGMGAITSVLWTFLSGGDEIIVDTTLYGCTFAFLTHGISRFGVKVTSVDMTDPENLARAISKQTAVVYFESPSNPNMRLVDIEAVSKIAHAHDAKVVVDNTYCSPYLQQPLKLGADLVVHSATKYLSGHGDLIAGLAAGSAEDMERVRLEGLKDMTGAVMDPFTAHLLMRGLKTLALRMERHGTSALEIAKRLQAHPLVDSVRYPGLDDFPQNELFHRQMKNGGGVLTFEVTGDVTTAMRTLDHLQLIKRAVSLGDADSLIQHPATMTHSTYTEEERAEHGISERLIRLSVGLEDVDDIWRDLENAFAHASRGDLQVA